MNILVTGSRGFIGLHLTKLLSEIIEYDIKDNPFHNVGNYSSVISFWEKAKPDVVIHLAANPNPALAWYNTELDAETNILGTINTLRASLKLGASLFIYTSTAHVYDVHSSCLPLSENSPCFPRNPYAVSKYAGELYCKHFMDRGLKVTILRFFNIYGPGQSRGYVIPDLLERIHKAEESTVEVLGPPDDTRDYVYVGDVVEAVKQVVDRQIANETINIGSGQETSTRQLCSLLSKVTKHVEFKFGERPVGRIASRFQADISKAHSLLDWRPRVNLEEGLRITAKSLGFT